MNEHTRSSLPAGFMRRLPPLAALAYFEVAARTRSFAAAAKELSVTPAAVSHQIKALEEQLGVALFIRHHRRVTPTAAALSILPRLQDGFAALVDAVDELRSQGEAKDVITVCAEPLFATKWLVPRLHRFYARHPEAEVRLQASLHSVDTAPGGPVTASAFSRAGIDLAIRFGYGEYPDMDSSLLLEVALEPVVASATGRSTIAEVLDEGALLTDNTAGRSNERFGWREWCEAAGKPFPADAREHHFGNGLLALEATLTGQGAWLVCPELVETELAAGTLRRLSEVALPCRFHYFIVSPERASPRAIVTDFRDWLLDERRLASGQPIGTAVPG